MYFTLVPKAPIKYSWQNIQNRYLPKECDITVLNPKGIDFEKYVNSVTVINDVDECMQVLQNTVEEMDNRYTLLLKSKTKNTVPKIEITGFKTYENFH